jgi:hypothetical protein
VKEGNPADIHGPHCPKCGAHSNWTAYPIREAENSDALRCETAIENDPAKGISVCGYIYWRRNAPPGEPTSKAAADIARAEYLREQRETILLQTNMERRARVRALVHSLLIGGYPVYQAGSLETVAVAERMDRAIETLAITQGCES